MLLSRIKGLIFVLKFSIEYNTDLSTGKKASELSFCARLKYIGIS